MAINLAPTFTAGVTTVANIGAIQNNCIVTLSNGDLILVGFGFNQGVTFSGTLTAKLRADGSLDTTYGVNGVAAYGLIYGNENAGFVGKSALLQSDGKLLIAGNLSTPTDTGIDFGLIRLNTDGSIDKAFSYPVGSLLVGADEVSSIALQADGKILIAGSIQTRYVGTDTQDVGIIRLNSDGSLDSSFSGDGKLILPVGTRLDQSSDVLVQADGKIIITGTSLIDYTLPNGILSSHDEYTIIRLNANGTLDTTFSGDGKVLIDVGGIQNSDRATSAILQSNGKLLVAGYSASGTGDDFSLVRLNIDGSLDTSFSTDGKITVDISGPGNSDYAQSIALQPDGKILIGGYSVNSFAVSSYSIVRLNANGSLDNTFSNDGKLEIPFEGRTIITPGSISDITISGFAREITVQDDGKILVGGALGGSGVNDFGLVRVNPNGTIDSAFGSNIFTGISSGNIDYYTFETTGIGTNVAPIVSSLIPNTNAITGNFFNYALPANTFFDANGEQLSYSATLSNGNTLPAWLTFNTSTRTFSGTPPSAGTVSIRVSATDSSSATAFDDFNLNVVNNNVAPNPNLAGVNMNLQFNNWQLISPTLLDNAITSGINEWQDFQNSFDEGNSIQTIDTNTRTAGTTLNGIEYDILGRNFLDDTPTYTFTSLSLRDASRNALSTGEVTFNIVTELYSGFFDRIAYNSASTNIDILGRADVDGFGNISTATYSQFKITANGFTYNITGNITTNANGDFTGGTISSLTISDNSGNNLSASGLTLSAVTFDQITDPATPPADFAALFNLLTSSASLSGNDTITGGNGDDNINGFAGNDTIRGGAGNDTLNGGDGNDTLRGGIGNDILNGGAGNDAYFIDVSSDVIEADTDGIDTVNVLYSAGTYSLAADLENINLLGTTNIDGIGNAFNNTIIGNIGDNQIDGGNGDDLLRGGEGNDTLIGGVGNDTLRGGIGNDSLNGGIGNDILNGGAGNDAYFIDVSSDVIEADTDGIDTVNVLYAVGTYSLAADLENINLLGTANISGIGNAFNNTIIGNIGDNQIDGGNGDDLLRGGEGNDTLIGGVGNDTLRGGIGNDSLNGGIGNDIMNGGAGNDAYFIDVSLDVIEADVSGVDTVNVLYSVGTYSLAADLENINLLGTANIDGIGNAFNNTIVGNIGDNQLRGGAGNDTLIGGDGNDTLRGGIDNDTLNGGIGNDILTGGLGVDTFVWNLADKGTNGLPALDRITDFSLTDDSLDLRDLLTGESGANILNFLDVTTSNAAGVTSTEIRISNTGGFAGGTFATAAENLHITLAGVNLLAGTNETDLLATLIAQNKLIID